MDIAKLMEAKSAWTLYTLLFDLQDRLFERYETHFVEFMKQDYNAYFKIKPAKK